MKKSDLRLKKSEHHIGARIRTLREALGYNIREFSEVTGIPSNTLSELENQKYEPSAQKLEALTRNTDVNAEWLLTGEGPMMQGDASGEISAGSQVELGNQRNFNQGERLKFIREKLGKVSQAEFADKLGVPLHKIKPVEAGNTRISLELALLIEQKLNYNLRWLLTGEVPMLREERKPHPEGDLLLDVDLLSKSVEVIERIIRVKCARVEPTKKAEMIALLYGISAKSGEIKEDVAEGFLRLVS